MLTTWSVVCTACGRRMRGIASMSSTRSNSFMPVIVVLSFSSALSSATSRAPVVVGCRHSWRSPLSATYPNPSGPTIGTSRRAELLVAFSVGRRRGRCYRCAHVEPAFPTSHAPRLPGRRRQLRRRVLHRREDHRHLLPAVVHGAQAAAGERRVLRQPARGHVLGLPRLQALPSARRGRPAARLGGAAARAPRSARPASASAPRTCARPASTRHGRGAISRSTTE